MEASPEFLGTTDVARALGCSEATVRRLVERGDLQAVRLTPISPRRIRAEDVRALIERAQGGAA